MTQPILPILSSGGTSTPTRVGFPAHARWYFPGVKKGVGNIFRMLRVYPARMAINQGYLLSSFWRKPKSMTVRSLILIRRLVSGWIPACAGMTRYFLTLSHAALELEFVIALPISLFVTPSASKDLISRSNDTERSPVSILATRD